MCLLELWPHLKTWLWQNLLLTHSCGCRHMTQFHGGCELEAALASLPCIRPLHGQLATQQLASSEQAAKNKSVCTRWISPSVMGWIVSPKIQIPWNLRMWPGSCCYFFPCSVYTCLVLSGCFPMSVYHCFLYATSSFWTHVKEVLSSSSFFRSVSLLCVLVVAHEKSDGSLTVVPL